MEGKRSRGRPRKRWIDQVNQDLEGKGVVKKMESGLLPSRATGDGQWMDSMINIRINFECALLCNAENEWLQVCVRVLIILLSSILQNTLKKLIRVAIPPPPLPQKFYPANTYHHTMHKVNNSEYWQPFIFAITNNIFIRQRTAYHCHLNWWQRDTGSV